MKDETLIVAHFECFEINKQDTYYFDEYIVIKESLFLCYKDDTGKM